MREEQNKGEREMSALSKDGEMEREKRERKRRTVRRNRVRE